MDPKSKEFKALQDVWYAKLAKEGFSDIEQNDQFRALKVWDSFRFRIKYSKVEYQAEQEYYRLAEHFYNSHKFKSEMDKVIWFYHMNDVPVRKILTELADRQMKSHKNQVHKIINDLIKIMVKECQYKKPT